ncbi:MAG: hypothetical protein WC302_00130 [Candidatus Paceibacterota bacterium]|jgi:hypothetical protein
MFSNKKIATLAFVSQQMDSLTIKGARTEMAKLGKEDILSYIGDDPQRKQLFLEYIYVGNRVGTNVTAGILDSKTIFLTWTPQWWKDLWVKLEPLVKQEREKREILNLYGGFEGFIKKIK